MHIYEDVTCIYRHVRQGVSIMQQEIDNHIYPKTSFEVQTSIYRYF